MFRENKNNLSTISSTSTIDSLTNNNTTNNTSTSNNGNMELIYENVPQRHVIKTQNRSNNSRLGGVVVPPGQVVTNGTEKKDDPKRLTQSIAAIAAQRRATQHHKDLMLELGQDGDHSSSPPASQSPNRVYNPNTSKDDTAAGSKGKKKKVKIKEVVQYKLPDDNSYQSLNNGASGANEDDYELVTFHFNYY